MAADKKDYLKDMMEKLRKVWPDNESMTVVCHGHSIPCGYMADNVTRPFDAYPHLFHTALAERFPHSVINVMVTATGGENSLSGAKRFKRDVLTHRPYLVTIDYGRNDMFLTEEEMRGAWTDMTTDAVDSGCKVLQVGLADVHGTFERLFAQGHKRSEYAASVNHPNRRGHEIIADCMMEWVPYV